MILNKDSAAYLDGDDIASSKSFVIGKSDLISREEFLLALTKGKTVLHIGCADHLAVIEEKRKKGSYLHDLLAANCSYLAGADINYEALEKMKGLGINELYHMDEIPSETEFDFILVPDVIEHLENVGQFLDSLKKISFKKAIFTTPNAYRLKNRLSITQETINTDHRYWFSPYTLMKTLHNGGFKVDQLVYTDKLYKRSPIRSLLIKLYPLLRDGLAVVARPSL